MGRALGRPATPASAFEGLHHLKNLPVQFRSTVAPRPPHKAANPPLTKTSPPRRSPGTKHQAGAYHGARSVPRGPRRLLLIAAPAVAGAPEPAASSRSGTFRLGSRPPPPSSRHTAVPLGAPAQGGRGTRLQGTRALPDAWAAQAALRGRGGNGRRAVRPQARQRMCVRLRGGPGCRRIASGPTHRGGPRRPRATSGVRRA